MHWKQFYAFGQSSSKFVFLSSFQQLLIRCTEMDSSDLSSTTEATATSGFILPTPPDVQVLIPQNYPGAFYYPPCKCDLVNQVIWWKLPYKLWHTCNNLTCTLNNLTFPQKFDILFKSMNFKPHNTCNIRKCIRRESLSFTYFYLFVHKYRIYLNTMTHSSHFRFVITTPRPDNSTTTMPITRG